MSRTPSQPGGTPGGGPSPGGKPAQPVKKVAGPAAAASPASSSATTPAAPVATAAAPQKPAGLAGPLSRRAVLMGGGSLVAVALLVALFVWKPWSPKPPRLNEDPAVIAKWAASPKLHRVPFAQQRQLMEVLDEKDKRVEEAYDQGMLTDQEYRRALQLGWYGEHLKKMDNFFSKPPTLRAMYLDKQVDKKIRKKKKKKDEPEPDSSSALKAEDIDRDDSTEEQDIERWPADVRQQWNDYRTAYASRKQYWKDFEKQRKAAQEANKGGDTRGDPAKGEPGQGDPAKGPEAAAPTGSQGPQ